MKKLITFLVYMLLIPVMVQARTTKPSTIKDATWLSSETVMVSKIDQARGNTPLGSIIAFPNYGNMSAYVSDDYVECDGRVIPANSDIRKKMGITRTPNLYKGLGASGKGYFIRAGATPQTVSQDTFRSHIHGQPSHTHYTSGGLISTEVTTRLDDDTVKGEAAPQKMVYRWTWWHNGASNLPFGQQADGPLGNWVPLGKYFGTDWKGSHAHSTNSGSTSTDPGHSHIAEAGGGGYLGVQDTEAVTSPSNVTGKVVNKTSTGMVLNRHTTGIAHASGGDNTYATGSDETAPTYYTTRYFMRVNE